MPPANAWASWLRPARMPSAGVRNDAVVENEFPAQHLRLRGLGLRPSNFHPRVLPTGRKTAHRAKQRYCNRPLIVACHLVFRKTLVRDGEALLTVAYRCKALLGELPRLVLPPDVEWRLLDKDGVVHHIELGLAGRDVDVHIRRKYRPKTMIANGIHAHWSRYPLGGNRRQARLRFPTQGACSRLTEPAGRHQAIRAGSE